MHENFEKLNVKTIDEQRLLKIESQLEATDKAIEEAERNDGDSLLDKSINEVNSIIGESTKIPKDPSYSHDVEQLKHLKNELLKAEASLRQKIETKVIPENQTSPLEKEEVFVDKNSQ